jgi:hypothetical protein
MQKFIYENVRTCRICRATHATFDEAQLDALPQDLSPNSNALWPALSRQPGAPLEPSDTVLTPPENFCVFAESSPFLRTFVVRIVVLCSFPHLGLLIVSDPMSHCNIVSEVTEFSSAAKIDWEHDLRYCTIIQVDDTPVFLVKDVHKALANVDQATHESIRLIVAQCRADPEPAPTPILQMAMDQMRAIHNVLHGWDLSPSPARPTGYIPSFARDCGQRRHHGSRTKTHTPHVSQRTPSEKNGGSRVLTTRQTQLIWNVWEAVAPLFRALLRDGGPPYLELLPERMWYIQST